MPLEPGRLQVCWRDEPRRPRPGCGLHQHRCDHWQVTYAGGASHDVITFMNGAAINVQDILFASRGALGTPACRALGSL